MTFVENTIHPLLYQLLIIYAWQRDLKKRLLIPILRMFACLVSIHSKASCLHQRQVSLAWFWCYGGSYFFQKYSSLHSRSLNNICTIAIPGEILARWCSWRAVELSHRLHSPHNPKPKPAHFNNSTTRRPRSEKPLQTFGSRTFLSFSCFRWQTRKLSADLRHHYCE